jgi:glutamyl-tRNA synthetase
VNGGDGKPLSKRHGSTSVEAFREDGVLPEALLNHLALLGWSKDAETTLLTREELVASFEIERVSKNPARFDTDKLEWMNNHYIQALDEDDLASRCLHFLTRAGLSPDLDLLRRAMPLVRERMTRLTHSVELLRFLFTDDIEPDERASALVSKAPEGYLTSVAQALSELDPWDAVAIKERLDRLAEDAGLSRTKAFQPVRAAVTGSTVSPPLDGSLELLGRERTVARLRAVA